MRPCAPASPCQPLAWPSPTAELVWVREPNANREPRTEKPQTEGFLPGHGGMAGVSSPTILRPLNPLAGAHRGLQPPLGRISPNHTALIFTA